MTRPGTVLPPSSAQELAIFALAGQGQYGVVSELAEDYGVSRQRVYDVRDRGRAALEAEFAPASEACTEGFTLAVTEQDIARTVIALRVVTPASIRDEVAMLPIIYGTGWSYGKIQGVLEQAGHRAASFLGQMDLSAIEHVALDEMFSQGRPVFAGIDLATQYLFQLEVHANRSGEAWGTALGRLRDDQGLDPSVVVKDAGTGLAKGVRDCWPTAREHDDLFHAVRMMGQEAYHLERRAYAAMGKVAELERRRDRARTERQRRSLGQRLRQARSHEARAIDRFDRFEALRREAGRVLDLADRGSGRLRTSDEVVDVLTRISQEMREVVGGARVRKVARYLGNRAKGLGRYLDDLGTRIAAVSPAAGGSQAVEAVVRAYQASLDHHRGGAPWDAKARQEELEAASRHLVEVTEAHPEQLLRAVRAVLPVLAHRYRASSAIENLNSVLRPYLVVQKSTSQPFLDLFRFYWNTRIREWGPHKGTSAYEQLTGERVDDWLSLLGYPPSERFSAAA